MKDEWWDDVLRNQPWAIWLPDYPDGGAWMPFSAELAVKYGAQGCLVRLIDGAEEFESLPRPAGRFPEPDPDAPPFSPQEIVWNERAARFSKDCYGERWERISAWLMKNTDREPMAVVGHWRRILGEWGGASDLTRIRQESKAFLEPLPLFEDPIPF